MNSVAHGRDKFLQQWSVQVVTLHAIKCDQKGVVSAQYLTLQHFSKFTNLQELHVILCRLYDNRFRPSVKLSASLTGMLLVNQCILSSLLAVLHLASGSVTIGVEQGMGLHPLRAFSARSIEEAKSSCTSQRKHHQRGGAGTLVRIKQSLDQAGAALLEDGM